MPLDQIAAELKQERLSAMAADDRASAGALLFVGPQSRGKAAAARLASQLGLALHAVDVGAIAGEAPAEVRRRLDQAFDGGEDGDVLVFEQAQALFGKRTGVQDAHDRYANIEVAYLLQKMETRRGPIILVAPRKAAIDSAFLRRLRFIVKVPASGPGAWVG